MQQKRRDVPTGLGTLPAQAPLANPYVPFQADDPEQYETGTALVRGTLYPGLDLPFMGMVNQNQLPQSAMAQLQELGFAVQELALYRRYQRLYHDKVEEYTRECGPLTHYMPSSDETYTWLDDPWPWEYCMNKEG